MALSRELCSGLIILAFLSFVYFLCKRQKVTHISLTIQDAASEIVGELQGVPDFIIGNYSDGNLVASLMAHKMGVTQVRVFFFFSYMLVMLLVYGTSHIWILVMNSVLLHMLWRKPSIQIQTFTGKISTKSIISLANSQLI